MTTLTNDQITAGAAVLCDHGQPIGRNAAIAVFDAMRAASPQVADIAELPKPWRERADFEKIPASRRAAIALHHVEQEIAELRDAIAASRRSPSPQVADIAELSNGEIDAIVYQCRQQGNDTTYDIVNAAIAASRRAAPRDVCAEMRALCSACGGTGDVVSLDGEWRGTCDCEASRAPASAGQAAPYHACLSVACSFEHDSVERHAAMSCVRAVQAAIATQPAEGAGQAGQGAKAEPTKMCRKKDGCEDMWKCSSARVGDCGAQDQIIERAAAPADHKIREAVNQLRDVAVQFHAHQSLRDRIAAVVLPLVKP